MTQVELDEELERLARESRARGPAAEPARTSAEAVPPPPPPRLASRLLRLVARLVDTALMLAFLVVALLAVALLLGAAAQLPEEVAAALGPLGGVATVAILILGVVGALVLMIYQWYLISTSGQTIGKRLVGVRVVCMDGSPVGFLDGVVLREWAPGLLFLIPWVGELLYLASLAPIFGAERRCVHDRLAGTKVVSTWRPGRLRLLLLLAALGAAAAALAWLRPDPAALLAALRGAPPAAEGAGSPAAARPDGADAAAEWRARLRDPEPRTRWTAVQALGRGSAGDGEEVVTALIGALADEHFMVRADAARALGALGPAARAAIPALERAAQGDPAGAVRQAADDALARLRR